MYGSDEERSALADRVIRFIRENGGTRDQVTSPSDVFLLCADLLPLQQEVLEVLCLDTKGNVTKRRRVFQGSLNESVIHPREVFRFAIEEAAASIILVHNHPSGDPTPSKQDIECTEPVVFAGKMIQIPVLDHVVVGSQGFRSMKEDRLI